MRHCGIRAPSVRARLATQRGAACLLTTFIGALLLFTSTGTSLYRTMTETQISSTSRDLHQAFYLAETALDYAIAALRARELPDGTYPDVDADAPLIPAIPNLPFGTARFTITTTRTEAINPNTQVLTRQVVAIGVSPTNVEARVTATVTETRPL